MRRGILRAGRGIGLDQVLTVIRLSALGCRCERGDQGTLLVIVVAVMLGFVDGVRFGPVSRPGADFTIRPLPANADYRFQSTSAPPGQEPADQERRRALVVLC
jgi:hypothetical protein